MVIILSRCILSNAFRKSMNISMHFKLFFFTPSIRRRRHRMWEAPKSQFWRSGPFSEGSYSPPTQFLEKVKNTEFKSEKYTPGYVPGVHKTANITKFGPTINREIETARGTKISILAPNWAKNGLKMTFWPKNCEILKWMFEMYLLTKYSKKCFRKDGHFWNLAQLKLRIPYLRLIIFWAPPTNEFRFDDSY